MEKIKGFYILLQHEPFFWFGGVLVLAAFAGIGFWGMPAFGSMLLPLVAVSAAFFALLPTLAKNGQPFEFERVGGFFDEKKTRELEEFAEYTGLSSTDAEHLLLGLLDLHLYTFAYHAPKRSIYIYTLPSDMDHCPHCAADLEDRHSGKCSSCRVVFSRMELHKPFHYL